MEIKPNDNLFLGSGKNFIKGESTWLGTRLMPYPSVFYGSICSLMLSLNEDKKEEYIKNNCEKADPRKYLKIGNVYLYNERNKHTYIPAPLDIFIDEDKKGQCYISELEKVDNNVICSVNIPYLFMCPESSERADGMFISLNTFYDNYYYNDDEIDVICSDDIVSNSYKVGIERNKNYTVKEGNLYRIDLTEFKEDENNSWSYLVEYEIKNNWWSNKENSIKKGYLKLGGENKVCRYYSKDIDIVSDYSYVEDEEEYDYVKLILMSPFIKKNDDWKLNIKNVNIIAASVGKSYNVGGFDLEYMLPKPMRKALPEGSIYILDVSRLADRTIRSITDYINGSQIFSQQQKYGFGKFKIVPFSSNLR
jgi:CRISPR-associated protein Cmr3